MIRLFKVVARLAPVLVLTTLIAAPAEAQVDDACSFQLSPPQAAALPGGAMGITATIRPTACRGRAQPTKSTVCISSPADPTACETGSAWTTARAFLGSTQHEVKITVTGVGCSTVSSAADADDVGIQNNSCQSLGPLEAII